MALSIDLAGRVALVTGGARGVGRGITDVLVDAGATVVVCGRTEPEPGTLPEGVGFLAVDVRDAEAVGSMVDRVAAEHGSLDVLVNNAGGSPGADAATASPRFTAKVVGLNLLAVLDVSQAANRVMQEQAHGGVIVNVGSLSGLRATPGTAAYGAAKAGLVNLTESLAMEWAPKVRLNLVSPGLVRTELFDDYWAGAGGAEALEATIPLGRAADPVDVGRAVAWLASDLASYVSGANLVLHGGGERLELHRFQQG